MDNLVKCLDNLKTAPFSLSLLNILTMGPSMLQLVLLGPVPMAHFARVLRNYKVYQQDCVVNVLGILQNLSVNDDKNETFRECGIIDALSFLVLESTDIYGETTTYQLTLFAVLANLLYNISVAEAEAQNQDEATEIVRQCALRLFEYIYEDSRQDVPQIGTEPAETMLSDLIECFNNLGVRIDNQEWLQYFLLLLNNFLARR